MGLLTQTQQEYYDSGDYGGYQFTSLEDIVNQFMVAYVGEDKIIPKTRRTDVIFHARRAMQELSFDTFKSCKSQEVEVCANLKVPLPHDYVNYVKITRTDSAGTEHIIYPTRHTSNPFAITQTDTDCTDCGDTSDTYQYGDTSSNVTDSNALKRQQADCGTSDVTCTFTAADSNIQGANQVKQAFESGGALFSQAYTVQEKTAYWNNWFANVDTYCNCLKNSNSDDNCGEFLGWDSFNISASNMTSEMNNNAGWSGLRYPIVNSKISRNQAVNGSWQSFTNTVTLTTDSSNTWDNYKSATPAENIDKYDDGTYDLMHGERYGINPQFSQVNGSFFIDCNKGMIHFSSNMSGQTIILHYISDSIGTDKEMKVHKFAEEAMYKWIAHAMLSTRSNIPEYIINRFKKERYAETRKAKLRLSNIKLEEITQILRGKSKQIKH